MSQFATEVFVDHFYTSEIFTCSTVDKNVQYFHNKMKQFVKLNRRAAMNLLLMIRSPETFRNLTIFPE